ncbi:hypothetical protein LTR78_005524 [Recurvomyces mirabilis]|uniref:RNA helicase n=1 Tax=Recurvomyces mirabilis TaxID=574656 RepID=A0AAE0WMB5_9PEZI|nr:hypothetical protein LTR78_005524 [Recurvomyces mirabilis]KAK5158485.1 hypothetical protein LTS14_003504 [Recurvomyces mirabilis]
MAKKKTKPASNPNRGFATTSVPKASQVDAAKGAERNLESKTVTPAAVSASTETKNGEHGCVKSQGSRELHELSPEELEASLEASELQQYVERFASKVRKDAVRQSSRLETDKRVLRGQADFLFVKDWLPDEIMQQIVDLACIEEKSEQSIPDKRSLFGSDEYTARFWSLRLCLLDAGIPADHVSEALIWLVTNAPPVDSATSAIWGLPEVLDWLALHCGRDSLDQYDHKKLHTLPAQDTSSVIEDSGGDEQSGVMQAESKAAHGRQVPSEAAAQPTGPEIEVSDVDSDMEPDELLAAYLRVKAKLFELSPILADGPPAKRKSTARTNQLPAPVSSTPSERKLLEKLRRIASDVLFDQREADAHWQSIRIDLAQAEADRKRLHISQEPTSASAPGITFTTDVNGEAERIGKELLEEADDSDGDGMLNGMFDALPGMANADKGAEGASHQTVSIRNFGKMNGMNPRRVLEEACKSRDSSVKVHVKQISPTTYASRHSITITWSRDQDLLDASYMPNVTLQQKVRVCCLSMTNLATPDTSQSEAYVATVALFLIFSGSPKEEKAHLKLPATLRDLWDELLQAKNDHANAADREEVRSIRTLVENAVTTAGTHDVDDDDEVVFQANSRQRSRMQSGVATPVNEPARDIAQNGLYSPDLAQIWANKVATPSYQRMLVSRINLPIFHYKAAALDTIARHPVTILVSETGSGKSTQLPAFILESELSQGRHCKVYCTEPRRISAISLANRVSEEMGERKGDVGTNRSLVGYAIRLESHTSSSTRLVYATTGIVLRMLENPNSLGDISHLVVDEVHERSIDTDFLLIILRSLMQRKPGLRIVLMSATVNAQRFSNYLDGAPIIDVPGRTFPVQAKYLEDAIELTGHIPEDGTATNDAEDYADSDVTDASAAKQLTGYSPKTLRTLASYDEYRIDHSLIIKLLQKVAYDPEYQLFSKAVLIFLPGIAEIRQLNDILGGHPSFRQGWLVYPLHSSFASEDQQAAFEIPPHGLRKIVLATNIAETGITIPDVTCVIDTGKHKEMRFDEKRQMSRLIMSFIARANAKQRRGRAGRVQEGLAFHLFTKHRHDEIMAENQTPEMLRLSLQELVMRVKICRLGGIEDALSQALDPPSTRNIRRAIDALVEVGALTTREELTSLGEQLAKLPLDGPLGKLILLGSVFGCLDFALTAAAALTSKSPFLSPMHAKKQADTVRLAFKRGDSDLGTLYNAYCAWRRTCMTQGMSEFHFCNKNFLSSQNLANIEDLKGQLLTSLVDAGFVALSPAEKAALSKVRPGARQRNFVMIPERYCVADSDDRVLCSVVAWSFYPKVIKQDGKGWRNIANNQALALHPSSVNKTSLPSDITMLSFYSILQATSKYTNAQETTPAPEIALVLLAGDAVFHMYAGVIVLDGNRLRYKVRDWRTMIVLKILRQKSKEVLARLFKHPGKDITGRSRPWMDILKRILDTRKQG